jgi:hypothetical protein
MKEVKKPHGLTRKVLETGGEATVSLSAGTEGDADGADDE